MGFEDKKSGGIPIDYDGTPFKIVGSEVRECQLGPDRSRRRIKEHEEDGTICQELARSMGVQH